MFYATFVIGKQNKIIKNSELNKYEIFTDEFNKINYQSGNLINIIILINNLSI